MIAGILSESAEPNAIYSVIVPLVVAHWITTAAKGSNWRLYALLMLTCEVWWELEVVTHMDKFRWWHEQRTLWGMLVAHWSIWLGKIV